MSRDCSSYFTFVGRSGFFAVIAAFVFLASSTCFADAPGHEDTADSIWASELAPVVDYGIFNEL